MDFSFTQPDNEDMAPPEENKWKEIGDRLRTVRAALDLSQVDICRILEVDTSRWNHWESGKNKPDVTIMSELARRYGVTLDYIYLGDMRLLPYEIAGKLHKAAL